MERKAFLTRFLQAVAEDLKIPCDVDIGSDKKTNSEKIEKDEAGEKEDE